MPSKGQFDLKKEIFSPCTPLAAEVTGLLMNAVAMP
jgi:hypothetical protein